MCNGRTMQSSMTLLAPQMPQKEEYSQPPGEIHAQDRTPHLHLELRINALKGLLAFTTALFVLFLFSLPFLSWLFNDVFGFAKNLCETPAEEIQCGGGVSYVEIAEKLGRRNAAGMLVGCGCEDGILRDWSCAVGTTSFSISYFISTAPGTGAMAALSAWPCIGMWFYGAGMLRKLSNTEGTHAATLDFVGGTLVAFQFFYGLFLMNTTCLAPTFHAISVTLFNVAAVVHYLAVAYTVDRSTRAGMYITISVAVGVAAIGLGAVWPESPSWLGQHAFWLGECIGLSSGMSIAPILLFFGPGVQDKLLVDSAPHLSV
mmetsp:Transcript_140226/g.364466  ORF Transcript_140226/g.364466 Transcript_140226/m.364466 type:complete len:316 (+) Transcript_140226:48-995(+)